MRLILNDALAQGGPPEEKPEKEEKEEKEEKAEKPEKEEKAEKAEKPEGNPGRGGGNRDVAGGGGDDGDGKGKGKDKEREKGQAVGKPAGGEGGGQLAEAKGRYKKVLERWAAQEESRVRLLRKAILASWTSRWAMEKPGP